MPPCSHVQLHVIMYRSRSLNTEHGSGALWSWSHPRSRPPLAGCGPGVRLGASVILALAQRVLIALITRDNWDNRVIRLV